MNINKELLEDIRKVKDERQIPTPKDKPDLSLVDWFTHIRTELRRYK